MLLGDESEVIRLRLCELLTQHRCDCVVLRAVHVAVDIRRYTPASMDELLICVAMLGSRMPVFAVNDVDIKGMTAVPADH